MSLHRCTLDSRDVRGIEQIPWLYDAGMAVIERTGLGRWRAWLAGGVPSGRVLDIGCGTGRNLVLFGRGVRPIGLDPCPQSLRRRDAGPPASRSCAPAPRPCPSATGRSMRW